MYYLKNRYYNPLTGLFLTPDNPLYIDFNNPNSYNLFRYCYNNPVMYRDPDGHIAIALSTLIAGIVFGALAGGVASGVSGWISGDRGWDLVGDILGGAIAGAGMGAATILGAGIGSSVIFGGVGFTLGTVSVSSGAAFCIAVGVSAATAGLGYAAQVGISPSKEWSTAEFFKKVGIGAVNGVFSFGTGYVSGLIALRIPFKGVAKLELKYKAIRFGIEKILDMPKYLLKLLEGYEN